MQKISKRKKVSQKFTYIRGIGQVGTRAYRRDRQLKNKSARRARRKNRGM